MRKTTILLLAFLFSFQTPSHAGNELLASHGIETEGLSAPEVALLVETLDEIGKLEAKNVVINPDVYYRLSGFKRLFGFSFDGKKLEEWILRRIKSVSRENTWTIAVNRNAGHFLIGDRFFDKSDFLERAYLLVHEARHSDGDGYRHVRCPEGHKFVSAGQPEMDLTKVKACDDTPDGAYGFHAAFLFELYARGLVDPERAGLLYNNAAARIIPSPKK
ncbi:MAG: hypothetical protein HY280_06775 [Nitrospinae bacterium]|nr:hypothetical protein [Nitrospinota bacterium]